LGGGLLTGKYRNGETGRKQGLNAVVHSEDDGRKVAVVDAVLAVAEEVSASPGQVAIAWVLAKGILSILGPRTLEQFRDNVAAEAVSLSREQMTRLDAASAIALGSPHDAAAGSRADLFGGRLGEFDLTSMPVR
jgi:aryl-alcohol dehydrogenase-like predicted oxidoreductase